MQTTRLKAVAATKLAIGALSSAYTGSGSSGGSDAADEVTVTKAPKTRAKTGAK